MEKHWTKIVKPTLKKKIRGPTLHGVRTYKATVVNTVWHWPKDRQIDPWNRGDSTEIDQLLIL